MPLYIVPTPLGNLADVTLRAVRVLREATVLLAEDTRTAKRLLHALEIPAPTLRAFHAHSDARAIAALLEPAREGVVAYVSDAGMPGVSDPGGELVRAARELDIPVEVLPGPCAFVGAAVLSGFAVAGLRFHGFAPRAAGERRRVFARALRDEGVGVWYESPHRILDTLAAIAELDARARVFVLREYTKRFEQQLLGPAADVAARLERPVRGEITFVLEPTDREDAPPAPKELDAAIEAGLAADEPPARLAKRLAATAGLPRAAVYARVVAAREARRERDNIKPQP